MTLLKALGLSLLILLLAAFGGGFLWLRASLPTLDGEERLTGLSASVTVERDSLGIPTITGDSRIDVTRALGFVHAQERFFQMDLLRRAGAGELAALLGPDLIDTDRSFRPHRFRARASTVLAQMDAADRTLVDAYTEGVNRGLEQLGGRPFEYLALRSEPLPWRPEDSVLVLYAMFIDLQRTDMLAHEWINVVRANSLPPALLRFLTPDGDRWDAPLLGDSMTPPPIPTPEDLEGYRVGDAYSPTRQPTDNPARGSNNWAVAGSLTAHGGAIVADDMHLTLRLPNIWYRASLVFSQANGMERRVTGATLPGAPAVVVGSNGALAWGFTNSYGDYGDLVRLVPDPSQDGYVRTHDASVPLDTLVERIEVAGGDPVTMDVIESPWGPVLHRDPDGTAYAFQWTAHHPDAVNFRLIAMETTDTVAEALDIANQSGIPAQNVMLGDRDGHIAWTIMGRLPRREGRDGQRPIASTDPDARWDGFLDPASYPRVIDPPEGRLWTANSRVVDGEDLAKIGLGPYIHGARAQQIRDGLRALQAPIDEADLYALQLDDRALFYTRWRDLLLTVLEQAPETPHRASMRTALADWSARADTADVGFRLARTFRYRTQQVLFPALQAGLDEQAQAEPEAALWQLVSHRPAHLLPPSYPSWEDLLLQLADRVALDADSDQDGDVDEYTWGAWHRSRVEHPMADAIPMFGASLRMPAFPVNGDTRMPNAMQQGFGPSQRMVVAPGREEDGIFQMPGGQAGHPLSPYWGAGHEDWAFGRPTPFLPGPTVWTLTLRPD